MNYHSFEYLLWISSRASLTQISALVNLFGGLWCGDSSPSGLRINVNLVEEKLLQGIKIGLIRIAPIRPLRIRDSKRTERNKRPDDVQQ